MVKQDLTKVFDNIRDNGDHGSKAYRVAEQMAPLVGTVAPVNDTDLALFVGQEYVDTTAGKKYWANNVTDATTTWVDYSV